LGDFILLRGALLLIRLLLRGRAQCIQLLLNALSSFGFFAGFLFLTTFPGELNPFPH
jgi:hypothetical protein